MDAWSSSTSPLAIVGPQFCAPVPVQLIFRKKIRGVTRRSFTATDASTGNVICETKSPLFSFFRHKTTLFDVATGNPLVSIQKKMLSSHGQWQVFKGDSYDPEDLLFTVEKAKIKLNVFLASNTSKNVCDFSIEGNYLRRSCKVYRGDSSTVIAQMNKESIRRDKLLDVDPNIDSAFIVALFVIRYHVSVARRKNILTLAALPVAIF